MTGAVRRFDATVAGGGSAGLATAITSARGGARTLLFERHGFMGGMGTASLVHSFCGLYLLRKKLKQCSPFRDSLPRPPGK